LTITTTITYLLNVRRLAKSESDSTEYVLRRVYGASSEFSPKLSQLARQFGTSPEVPWCKVVCSPTFHCIGLWM